MPARYVVVRLMAAITLLGFAHKVGFIGSRTPPDGTLFHAVRHSS
jgi:hypothetical protein